MSATAPSAHSIQVRVPHLEWPADAPRYWMDAAPFATHFLNALSSVFPDGEAFFVRSVLRFREQIDDPRLRREIQAFAGQEGQHSHQHGRHVELLISQGYTGLRLRNALLKRITRIAVDRAPKLSLAGTAALEHLTAILARRLLSEPENWLARMHPAMAPLWEWHAAEEAEHKAVAFDVLMQVAPSRAGRAWALASNTVGLFIEAMDRTVYMLWKDGLLFRRDVWRDGWTFLFGTEGLLRGLGADYWLWYRRDFHPRDTDDRRLIDAFEQRAGHAFEIRSPPGAG